MAAPRTITSANSQLIFSVPDLDLVVPIYGYAADAAFANDPITAAETTMGVDGNMSAGYIFKEVKQKITLSPDSPSKQTFDAIYDLMTSTREVVFIDATLTLPSTGEQYTFTKGVMITYHGAPAAKKVLQPVEYEINWQSVSKAID